MGALLPSACAWSLAKPEALMHRNLRHSSLLEAAVSAIRPVLRLHFGDQWCEQYLICWQAPGTLTQSHMPTMQARQGSLRSNACLRSVSMATLSSGSRKCSS